MSKTISRTPITVCYKTEVASIIRGHHVCEEVWDAAIGEMLEAASDDREEAKEYDKNAVGLYKKDILVGHIPIEISSLCFHFISQDPRNKIKELTTGKRQREIGFVVPAKLIFITNNKRFSEVLEVLWQFTAYRKFLNGEAVYHRSLCLTRVDKIRTKRNLLVTSTYQIIFRQKKQKSVTIYSKRSLKGILCKILKTWHII